MASILLNTGMVLDVPGADRPTILTALAAAGGSATGTVNGVTVTVRAAAVVAVADNAEGLRPLWLNPTNIPDPNWRA